MTRKDGSLLQEIRQKRPFATPAHEAALGILKTADLVRRSLGKPLEAHDITHQQYNVLRILRGSVEKGLPTLEIASRMLEQTPGITRLIDRLEAKGLVDRQRTEEDRRQVFCRISSKGLDLLSELDQPMDSATASTMARLSGGDLDTLVELLDKVRNALN